MSKYSTIMVSGLTLLLMACGGGKTLSFKNSDEVIKSYKAVTANLTEAERLDFRRNMFLVAWTSDKASADISFKDVQSAWEYERNTLDLTGPDATPLAKELALRGITKLDGKTVAQVNALGSSVTDLAVGAKITSLEKNIASVEAAIVQLKADKASWQALKEKAATAEKTLVNEAKKYKPKIISESIGKDWQGLVLKGKVSFSSPYEDPINDFRNAFTVEHNGHQVRYTGVLGQFNRYNQEFPFQLSLNPKNFVNEAGDRLPKDYIMPNDLSAYEYSFRPTWVRTSGKRNGWQTHEHKLEDKLTQALYRLPQALKTCDDSIDTAQKFSVSLEAQIEVLQNNDFDNLNSVYGRFAESCF